MQMDTAHPAHPRGDDGLLRITASADGRAASQMIKQLRAWLIRSVAIDEQRCSDVVLATYEALANCADHAYRHHGQPGKMTLHLSHDAHNSTVQICVEDRGRWIAPEPRPIIRGRGLHLIKALADDVSVNGRDDGTTICLHFTHCPLAQVPSR